MTPTPFRGACLSLKRERERERERDGHCGPFLNYFGTKGRGFYSQHQILDGHFHKNLFKKLKGLLEKVRK